MEAEEATFVQEDIEKQRILEKGLAKLNKVAEVHLQTHKFLLQHPFLVFVSHVISFGYTQLFANDSHKFDDTYLTNTLSHSLTCQWEDYLENDGTPDPADEPQLNTMMSEWEESDDKELKSTLKACTDAHKVFTGTLISGRSCN